jgi:hypothetical protein
MTLVKYMHYGEEKTGTVDHVGKSGIVFLTDGKFLFPESIIPEDIPDREMRGTDGQT